jgi:short-subunit dehydrogenase
MSLKENILINGCSRGLGYDFYRYLKSKYNVYGLSSNKKNYKNIFYYDPFDDPKIENDLIDKIKNCKIDHVIHCSGGGFRFYDKYLEINKLIKLFNVNFFSIYEINKILIKNKLKNKRLNIIMIGSLAVFENKASIGYSASKSVLLNYNKTLASNFLKDNVVSKLLIPGSFISTNGSMTRLKKKNKKIFKRLEKLIPGGKMQNSKNIIRLTEFLLKKESDLMNGTYISLSNLESNSIFL